jgi:hypothetical protein
MIGVRFPSEAGIFLFTTASKPAETYPASYPMCTGCSFPGVKRPEYEAGHSPPSTDEVKMRGDIPPLPNTSSGYGA